MREKANRLLDFFRTGGCMDGDHKAWIIVDVDSKEEARAVVPPAFRPHATIRKLNRFTMEEIEEILRHHGSCRETA